MKEIKAQSNKHTPTSVPTASQIRVYYSNDIRAAGGVKAWLQTIGSDKPKHLPEITISEEEWNQMLKENL